MINTPGELAPSYNSSTTGTSRLCQCEAVTIALVNNMPDSGLQATERQFCALLSAASVGMLVKLKFYSIPGISRSNSARSHVERYYEDFIDLQHNPPDGLIVTGTEPGARCLSDEPFWPSLRSLIEWADSNGIPSIWSCLAAHAAVLEIDGIERYPLGGKLSGLFECQIRPHKHHILHGLPTRWRVPHSRLYGLRENALLSGGYTILSHSRDVGPDIFLRQGRALHLFFQGHPEYRAATLMSEYRRDVGKFLNGERSSYPAMPVGQHSADVASKFARIADRAIRKRSPDALAAFDAIVSETTLEDCWSREARRIYVNWLTYVSDRRNYPASQSQLGMAAPESSQVVASTITMTNAG